MMSLVQELGSFFSALFVGKRLLIRIQKGYTLESGSQQDVYGIHPPYDFANSFGYPPFILHWRPSPLTHLLSCSRTVCHGFSWLASNRLSHAARSELIAALQLFRTTFLTISMEHLV